MPLPSSGNISLADILAEFHAPLGTRLTQMVKGGTYVPSVTAANIPTAPPIKLSDFYGAFRAPSVEIQSATASVSGDGTLAGASVADNVGTFVVQHTTFFGNLSAFGDNAGATCTLSVPVKVVTATTPNLSLSVGAQNPTSGGARLPYVTVSPPPFDDLAQTSNPTGPGASDTAESYQGSWSITASQLDAGGIDPNDRVGNSIPLGPVVDNDIVTLTFTLTHLFSARIGAQSNFGDILTFSLADATFVRFRLSLLFLDGSANIVQDCPIDILIYHRGTLRAVCVEFA